MIECPYTKCVGIEKCLTYQEEIFIPKIEEEMTKQELKKREGDSK